MKELFNTKSALFMECQNSIPTSRYSRLNMAGYVGNQTFSNIKWNSIKWSKVPKMAVLKREYLELGIEY